jgi:DNA-binding transcriptional LysR family regulator
VTAAARRLEVSQPTVTSRIQQRDIDFALRSERELYSRNLRVGATGPFYILSTIATFRGQYPRVQVSLGRMPSPICYPSHHAWRR